MLTVSESASIPIQEVSAFDFSVGYSNDVTLPLPQSLRWCAMTLDRPLGVFFSLHSVVMSSLLVLVSLAAHGSTLTGFQDSVLSD